MQTHFQVCRHPSEGKTTVFGVIKIDKNGEEAYEGETKNKTKQSKNKNKQTNKQHKTKQNKRAQMYHFYTASENSPIQFLTVDIGKRPETKVPLHAY